MSSGSCKLKMKSNKKLLLDDLKYKTLTTIVKTWKAKNDH